MPPAATWIKMSAAGLAMCIGGPALVYYVSPTEEELFKRYNPELQRRSLENRYQKQADFDNFVTNLKEYSKSDKHIWHAAAEAELKRAEEAKQKILDERSAVSAAAKQKKDEMTASLSDGTAKVAEQATKPKSKGFWAS